MLICSEGRRFFFDELANLWLDEVEEDEGGAIDDSFSEILRGGSLITGRGGSSSR